jgi:fluoride ion exporter CrcB/FEX
MDRARNLVGRAMSVGLRAFVSPWSLGALAFAGGTAGSLLRGAVQAGFEASGAPAWAAHATVNVVGALAIGLIIARLGARDDGGRPTGIPPERAASEHLLVAGFLGGLTTVSGLAQDLAGLVAGGPAIDMVVAMACNGALGLAACAVGVRLGSRGGPRAGRATLR